MQTITVNDILKNISSLSIEEQYVIAETLNEKVYGLRRPQIFIRAEKADRNYRTDKFVKNVIEEIKNSPQNPKNITPASGLLAAHIADSPEIYDPLSDVAEWNREWDEVEMKMKTEEIAEQKAERELL